MQSVFVILVHWIVIYAVDSAIQLLNNRGLVVNMSECLLRIHVRNIFSPFVTRCPTINLCATQDVYQLDPFLLREIFYSLLLDWVQIWMRKLHHDIHVMNTQLAIYDADSRCLYMQIETVSTCCWEQKAHPDVIITPGYLMLIFFSLFFILGLCTSTLIL